MAKAQRKHNDLADLEAEEAREGGADFVRSPDDQIVDDSLEMAQLANERGEVIGVGEDEPINFPIRSLEDLEKRDAILAARGASRGVSNDLQARLNFIPTGGLKRAAPANEADRMQKILSMVGPEAFRQMVKEGLV